MKRVIGWSYQSSMVIVVLQIMVPVCLMTCGPASAKDLTTKHDLPPNATHCPAHPDSNDSQNSQPPDRTSSCERTHIGVVLTSSSRYNFDSPHRVQLIVPSLTLVELDAFVHTSDTRAPLVDSPTSWHPPALDAASQVFPLSALEVFWTPSV